MALPFVSHFKGTGQPGYRPLAVCLRHWGMTCVPGLLVLVSPVFFLPCTAQHGAQVLVGH